MLSNHGSENGVARDSRRILKVRLRQDQVIRLHELRILEGKSIATLLEDILEDYFDRSDGPGNPMPGGGDPFPQPRGPSPP